MPAPLDHELHDVVVEPDVDPRTARLRATWWLPHGAPILAGHFPNRPLVPGVVLLDAVRVACERAFAMRLELREVPDVRFSRPLAPDERARLAATVIRDADGVLDVSGVWTTTDEPAQRVAAFHLRCASTRSHA